MQDQIVGCVKSKILHDNTPARKSKLVPELVPEYTQKKVETVPHPAYSPDLAPYDLVPHLKKCLNGRMFHTHSALEALIFYFLSLTP